MKIEIENKNYAEHFARKVDAEINKYWGDIYLNPEEDTIDIKLLTEGFELNGFALKRSYKKYDYPKSWDLVLEIVDSEYEDTENAKGFESLQFPIYNWIENDVCDETNWTYGSVEDFKMEIWRLAWDVLEPWEKFMTQSFRETIERTIRNEIEHQVWRFRSDIDELINKYNNGEIEVEA